jgi:hypothetical protein
MRDQIWKLAFPETANSLSLRTGGQLARRCVCSSCQTFRHGGKNSFRGPSGSKCGDEVQEKFFGLGSVRERLTSAFVKDERMAVGRVVKYDIGIPTTVIRVKNGGLNISWMPVPQAPSQRGGLFLESGGKGIDVGPALHHYVQTT